MNFSTRDLGKHRFGEVNNVDKTYNITIEEIRKTDNQVLIRKSANGLIFMSNIIQFKEEWYEWWYDLDMMEEHIYDIMEKGIHADGNKIHCIVYPREDRDKLPRRFDEVQHLDRQQIEECNRQLMKGLRKEQKRKHLNTAHENEGGTVMFGSKPTELLRDESKHSKYRCKDQECENACANCPIHTKTDGDISLQSGDNMGAIAHYTESIKMAPDFAEAWNNLGNAFGMSNEYNKALSAFNVAIGIDPLYGKALYGKVITLANLERNQEALAVCDVILKSYNCGIVKNKKKELLKSTGKQREIDIEAIEQFKNNFVNSITQKASALGYVRNPLSYVPELTAISRTFNDKCILNLIKEDIASPQIMLAWCLYGGIGAAAHWDKDWPALANSDLFDILTRERGLDEMDEYVIDFVGIGFGSANSDKLVDLINECLFLFMTEFSKASKGTDNATQKALIDDACSGMYLLGVAVQLNRLGMH